MFIRWAAACLVRFPSSSNLNYLYSAICNENTLPTYMKECDLARGYVQVCDAGTGGM